MSSEITKEFINERHYITAEEVAKKKIERELHHKSTQESYTRSHEKYSIPIIIDGVKYPSLKSASAATGICLATMVRKAKELRNSFRSEIEFDIKITKTFTFKKARNETPDKA